jgi:hypothetical protein
MRALPPTAGDSSIQGFARSASQHVPDPAVSSIHFARLIRTGTGGRSHVPFVVRNDGNTTTAVAQTCTPTWLPDGRTRPIHEKD